MVQVSRWLAGLFVAALARPVHADGPELAAVPEPEQEPAVWSYDAAARVQTPLPPPPPVRDSAEVSARGDVEPTRDRAPPEAPRREPDRQPHDGLYLRLGLGFGGSFQSATADDETNASAVSGGGAAELALGAAIAPGLVLGGGIWASVASWTLYARRDADDPFDPARDHELALLGFFADHYLPGRNGLHAQLGLGLAELGGYTRLRGEPGGKVALGGGVMLGLGYETLLDDAWGLGVLARLTSALTHQLGERDIWLHTTVPALLVTTTYN